MKLSIKQGIKKRKQENPESFLFYLQRHLVRLLV